MKHEIEAFQAALARCNEPGDVTDAAAAVLDGAVRALKQARPASLADMIAIVEALAAVGEPLDAADVLEQLRAIVGPS